MLEARRPRAEGLASHPLAVGVDVRAVVLVEGVSDQAALEALAERRGRNLVAEGIAVVAIGGAQAIGNALARFGPHGSNLRLAGLCDAGEEGDVRCALERAGLGCDLTRADMEALGFYVCDADLEDELIRSLGVDAVERVVDAQRDLGSFRTFQQQPAQQGRAHQAQLRRFMGTRSGRKIHYARVLVEELELTEVPRPLDGALAHVHRVVEVMPPDTNHGAKVAGPVLRLGKRKPEAPTCRERLVSAAMRLTQRTGGETFLMRDLVAELRASGAPYRKDTVYKTIRRMTGRTGRSDWAEFEQVESGTLRLRPGVALVGDALRPIV